MKVLALFSGGLDSSLAIKVVQNQGIEVIALNFVSHFFGGRSERIERSAKELGVQLEYILFKEEQLKVVESPVFGYGKNMNPCIDCHGLMLKIAGNLLETYNASFVITGEVLGQRPKSQVQTALGKVESLSEISGLVLRPLSAKLLPETIAEKNGWVDREKLFDFRGRNRKPQMALAKSLGLREYPNPGGGCRLTDPSYSNRLRLLKQNGFFTQPELLNLIRSARFLNLGKGKLVLVGRDAATNERLEQKAHLADRRLIAYTDQPGPTILGFGDLTSEEIQLMLDVFSLYSKVKGQAEQWVELNGKRTLSRVIDVKFVQDQILKLNVV